MALIAARVLDSTHLELVAPIEAGEGRLVMLAILDPDTEDPDREEWLGLWTEALSAAYGDDEPEYTLDMVKEPNPDFRP